MLRHQVPKIVRLSLLWLGIVVPCGCISGCAQDEQKIEIPENPLPLPGPDARLKRSNPQSVEIGSETNQSRN